MSLRKRIEATPAFIKRQQINSFDLAKVLGCQPASIGPTLTSMTESGVLVRRGRVRRGDASGGKKYQVFERPEVSAGLSMRFRTVPDDRLGICPAKARGLMR